MPFPQQTFRGYMFGAGLKRKCPAKFQQSEIKTLTYNAQHTYYREGQNTDVARAPSVF